TGCRPPSGGYCSRPKWMRRPCRDSARGRSACSLRRRCRPDSSAFRDWSRRSSAHTSAPAPTEDTRAARSPATDVVVALGPPPSLERDAGRLVTPGLDAHHWFHIEQLDIGLPRLELVVRAADRAARGVRNV